MKMQRLRSERGATILMALLLVLVAVMVSALILSSAVNAVRRVKSDRDAQQDYLTVSSAAELIRDSILHQSYVKTEVREMDKDGNETDQREDETEPTGLMSAWLTAGARSGGCTDTISLTVSDNEKAAALKTVYVRFTMDGNYNITAELSLNGAADGAADDCRMTLAFKGEKTTTTVKGTENGDGTPYTETKKTTITWTNPQIVKGVKGTGGSK